MRTIKIYILRNISGYLTPEKYIVKSSAKTFGELKKELLLQNIVL